LEKKLEEEKQNKIKNRNVLEHNQLLEPEAEIVLSLRRFTLSDFLDESQGKKALMPVKRKRGRPRKVVKRYKLYSWFLKIIYSFSF
jgi:hypothetical protein